jgi:hypothetical protein
MASAWGQSWGLSWGNDWGVISGEVTPKRVEGYGNSPEPRKKHPQPSSGIFSDLVLTAELEAKLFESETELEQITQGIPATPSVITEKTQPAAVVSDSILPKRAIDLQAAIVALKAQLAAQLKHEADKKRKVRQARDNKDLAEFMMAFSVIVTGKDNSCASI